MKSGNISSIVVFMIFSIFSCNKKSQQTVSSEDVNVIKTQLSSIKMIKTMCRGYCPEYTLDISDSGKMTFHGRKNVPRLGNFHAELVDDLAKEIESLIDKSDFAQLEKVYSSGAMDLPSTYITYDDKTIRVQNQAPKALTELIEYLHALVLSTNWLTDSN